MSSEHQSRAPHPPLYPRLPSPRFKFQEKGPQSGRVPVVLDEFALLVAGGGSTGLEECINRAIEAITEEAHQKQRPQRQHQPQQQLKQHQPHQQQYKFSSSHPVPPIKHDDDTKSPSSPPRRSPSRQASLFSAALVKSSDSLPSDDVFALCLFCEAAHSDHESKQRRDRSLFTSTNPVTGNELSPGGALPMRTPVATCHRCNSGVCEFHLMLHSVKMPGHWDCVSFYDSVVDSAYRSLPPHAQLLSRVMLSIDTIRKRAVQQKAQGSGFCNPYNNNKNVYRRDPEWEGSNYQSFEISSVLARSASMLPQGPKKRGDDALSFDSRFESGNLARAERIGPSEYVLYIREDINLVPSSCREKCYNQWFYFRVDGMQDMRSYTFHICNMYKAKSLFQAGMHVLLRSPESDEWFRGGSSYIYKESTFYKKGSKIMHQLSFRICSLHSSLYVAAAQPYTYTDLCAALGMWQGQDERAAFMKRRTLCKTLAGNAVEFVTITDPQTDCATTSAVFSRITSHIPENKRPWIVVCGRVHPSECNSSWFVHGLIEFLTDPRNSLAEELRRQFVWLVVPMINPDGVICGNSRCNLAGLDLNRCWANPLESTCPTIFHAKALLQRLCPLVTITLFLDVHGHSRKRGAFFYGNRRQQRSATGQLMPFTSTPVGHEVKLPQIFAACSSIFSLDDCSYTIDRRKMGTARYVMFNEFQLLNSFTLEISMFAAVLAGESSSFIAMSQDVESSAAVQPSTVVEATNGLPTEEKIGKDSNRCNSIPQHFEKEDFMQLSRDFATCLISSDRSWMTDPSGGIIKMSLSSSSSFIYAANTEDSCVDSQKVETLTPERKHVEQWLSSRGICISNDSAPQQVESRLLAECKSVKRSGDVRKDLIPPAIDPSCASLTKLLLSSARAHHELQGETANTCASVKSFIQNQLRKHVKQTDSDQLLSMLRALADWMEFVIKFNSQELSQPRDLEWSTPKLSESSFNMDLAALTAVRRRINDALELLKQAQGTGSFESPRSRFAMAQDHDTHPVEDPHAADNSENDDSMQPSCLSDSTDPLHTRVVSTQINCVTKMENSSSSASAATSHTVSQPLDNAVKPWSLTFINAHSITRPSPSATSSLDTSSHIPTQPPFGSRMRQRILQRRSGRPDAVDTSKKEAPGTTTIIVNPMHVVSLDIPNITNPLPSVYQHLPSTLSSIRRIRVPGALPFPHQQHQSSSSQKHSASTTEPHHQSSSRLASAVLPKPQMSYDAFGGGVTRPIEFSFVQRGAGSADNLWSFPSVVGGIAEADMRKSNVNTAIGEVLVLKQPPVTTVQPFEKETLPPKVSCKQPLRPSTHR